MSAAERAENRLHAAFRKAREARKELWPEPETTALYKIVYRAALYICASRDSRLLYSYGKHVAAGRIASEVLLNIDKFNGHSRFSTWLYRTARNELYDIVKEVKTRTEVQLDSVPDIEAVYHSGQLRLPAGLLSDLEERLVRLRLEEGYNFRELAKILEISLVGAHRLWRSATLKLRSRLKN
jgi:RNA polymerase sigma factor (sigma-70 family)